MVQDVAFAAASLLFQSYLATIHSFPLLAPKDSAVLVINVEKVSCATVTKGLYHFQHEGKHDLHLILPLLHPPAHG